MSTGVQWLVFQKGKTKIQAWKRDYSGWTERSLPAVFKNQEWLEGDEHRTRAHTLCQELQSIKWMLLPLACVATGHCRGQKHLNGAKNQLGKDLGENPVKGCLKQLHRYRLRLKRPLSPEHHCLAGLVSNILPSPFALISSPAYWITKTHKILG